MVVVMVVAVVVGSAGEDARGAAALQGLVCRALRLQPVACRAVWRLGVSVGWDVGLDRVAVSPPKLRNLRAYI